MAPRRKSLPSDMSHVEETRGSEREALAAWWKERIHDIENIYEERIKVLRTVGEHPSPVFAKIVRMDGALGMPKKLLAKKLGMSIDTLISHYGDEYDLGAAEVISQVAANMIRIGTSMTDPNAARVGMQILDRRGDEEWRPPSQKLEVDDKRDAAPTIDSSKLTFEERAQLRDMILRVQSNAAVEMDTVDDGESPA